MALDKRALKILTDTYWSAAGWKHRPTVAPSDFAYAKKMGLMFDPDSRTHDQAVAAACKAVSQTYDRQVSQAFIASLGSRRLDLRSALGSFAVGRHLERHSMAAAKPGSTSCGYCGEYADAGGDLNVLNFERFKWGGVRHDNVRYIAFDLQLFASLEIPEPTKKDYASLRSIFDAVENLPATARLKDLERALSKFLRSNSSERRTLIGILGFAGILVDPTRADYRNGFVPCPDRERTAWSKDDWPYPVQWWTGRCGLNQIAVSEWFPDI